MSLPALTLDQLARGLSVLLPCCSYDCISLDEAVTLSSSYV